MKIRLTRESVCAADDCHAPHEKNLTVPDDSTVQDLAETIQREYLPKIQGGRATWSLVTRVPVAVLAQQWREAKVIFPFDDVVAKLASPGGPVRLHVNYHAQLDPDVVLEVLKELNLETTQQGGGHVR